jgi:hypothetical protein
MPAARSATSRAGVACSGVETLVRVKMRAEHRAWKGEKRVCWEMRDRSMIAVFGKAVHLWVSIWLPITSRSLSENV